MTTLQELYHDQDYDYRSNSPHLAHWALYDRLVELIRRELREVATTGPLDVVEIGAGHGGFTEPILAMGARVTAVEMSRASLRHLEARFGTNDRFRAAYDPDGDLSAVSGEFGAVVAVSVLHHIPDYATFLATAASHVRRGGMILTLQDPLWYPRVGVWVHRLDRLSYYAWRVRRGRLRQGLSTLSRRMQHVYDESNPADMVEYHVVRQGVDEDSATDTLRPLFSSVEEYRYWSSHLTSSQRLGTRFGLANTFGIIARDRLGARAE